MNLIGQPAALRTFPAPLNHPLAEKLVAVSAIGPLAVESALHGLPRKVPDAVDVMESVDPVLSAVNAPAKPRRAASRKPQTG